MKHRLSPTCLAHLASRLNDHAHTVIALLAEQRFATTGQLARLLRPRFTSDTSALRQTNRLMKTLRQHGVASTTERRIGGARAGSSSNIWHLTEGGYRLHRLTAASQLPLERRPRRRRTSEPSWTFLTHTLAVTELRITTEEACRQSSVQLQGVESEPHCWRSYLGVHGQTEWVKPDLGLVTAGARYVDHWWCEVDMATERPVRIGRKVDAYLRYFNSGREQQLRGTFPVVVWIVPNTERAEQLAQVLGVRPELPDGMFWVTTLDEWPRRLASAAGMDSTATTS